MSTVFFNPDTTPEARAKLRALIGTGSVEERARQVRSGLGDKSLSQASSGRIANSRPFFFIDKELTGEIRSQNASAKAKAKSKPKVGSKSVEASEQRRRIAGRVGAQRALLGGKAPSAVQGSIFKGNLGGTGRLTR